MRNNGTTLAAAAIVALALSACGGKTDDQSPERASAPVAEAPAPDARQARKPEPAAKPPVPATENAAAAAPEEALRFDMTQDGEAQTAEAFDAWMDARGVRVAEGAERGAAVHPDKPAVDVEPRPGNEKSAEAGTD